MKPSFINRNPNSFFSALLISVALGFALSGCSDDEKPKTESQAASTPANSQQADTTPYFDHEHGPDVTDMQKHKFEHDFAAQCVEREMKSAGNSVENADMLEKSCECIATYMMKDLTAPEAKKFLENKENPQSLRIKYDAAAYHCLQEKSKVAGPNLSGKPQS